MNNSMGESMVKQHTPHKREEKKPRYKHGKLTTPITFKHFKAVMEKGFFMKGDYHRSYLAFLYWFGVRRSEALALKHSDFTVDKKKEIMIVDCLAVKGGERAPLEIDLKLPYVILILKQVLKTMKKKRERVWAFTGVTAWHIVKRSMGDRYYPHFFRLNRATKYLEDPKTTIPEMMGWFGWKASKTVDAYIGYSRRYIKTQSNRLNRDLKT